MQNHLEEADGEICPSELICIPQREQQVVCSIHTFNPISEYFFFVSHSLQRLFAIFQQLFAYFSSMQLL